jgi:hypothetical protein
MPASMLFDLIAKPRPDDTYFSGNGYKYNENIVNKITTNTKNKKSSTLQT